MPSKRTINNASIHYRRLEIEASHIGKIYELKPHTDCAKEFIGRAVFIVRGAAWREADKYLIVLECVAQPTMFLDLTRYELARFMRPYKKKTVSSRGKKS